MPHKNWQKSFSNLKEAHNFLLNLDKQKKRQYNTDNILSFLFYNKNPQDSYKTIHVAGTSGKGSTCVMLSSILTTAGYKTGLTISPYLSDPLEKIQINNHKIADKAFIKLVNKYKKNLIEYKLSYFEAFMALIFLYFQEQKVDYAVIETGLGGRLDASNVLKNPSLSIITNIGLDHTDVLGKTKKKIAREKSAIIKNKNAITGSHLIKNAKFIDVKKHHQFKLKMLGEFQQENAEMAYQAAKFLKIPEKYIKRGLAKAELFGRFSIIKKNPLIIADGAHNPNKMQALIFSLKKIIDLRRYNQRYLLIAIKHDKDYKNILKKIVPLFDNIFITTFSQGLKPEIIQKEIKKYHKKSIIIRNPKIAYNKILKKIHENDLFVITGSLYMIGDIF
jgi:dihydrofolate synthase/folylpolyglutamate synthase